MYTLWAHDRTECVGDNPTESRFVVRRQTASWLRIGGSQKRTTEAAFSIIAAVFNARVNGWRNAYRLRRLHGRLRQICVVNNSNMVWSRITKRGDDVDFRNCHFLVSLCLENFRRKWTKFYADHAVIIWADFNTRPQRRYIINTTQCEGVPLRHQLCFLLFAAGINPNVFRTVYKL